MKKIEKYKYYILSFLIPFLFFFVFLFFYNHSFLDLLIGDSGEQYIYFLDYFKGILNGDKSIFYSFSSGIGGNFFSTYLYYLSSPLNLLLIFVSYKYIHVFFGLLVFFKIGLSGLNMFIYLKSKKNNNQSVCLLFSLCYSLMTYNILYYFNIMWLDVIFLTPLVILGIDDIFTKNNNKKYITFLSLSIFSNFYISYMLCIFCVIYFFYKLFCIYNIKINRDEIKKKVKSFFYGSLISGLICAIIIIPLVFLVTYFYRNDGIYNYSKLYFFWNFFSQIGVKSFSNSSADYYLPYFHSSFLIFLLFINFLLFERNSKNKKMTIIVILIFIFSIMFEPLSLVWHGFTKPVGLLFRFVFLFTFFLIISASDWINIYHEFNKKQLFVICFLWSAFFCISNLLSNQSLNIVNLISNLFFVIGSLLLLNNKTNVNYLIIFFLIEAFFSMKNIFLTNYSFEIDSKINQVDDRNKICEFFDNLDNNFYRVGGNDNYSKSNSLFACKHNGINLFLTTNNKNIYKFLKKSGYYVNSAYAQDNDNLILMNSILGIKYFYTEDVENDYYKKYNSFYFNDVSYKVYKNPDALSLGFMINSSNLHILNTVNSFEYQNNIFSFLIDKNIKVFRNQKIENLLNDRNKKSYLVNIENGKNHYFYIEPSKIKTKQRFNIYIDDNLIYQEYSITDGIVKVDYNKSGNHILTVESSENGINNIKSINVYSYDDDNADRIIKILSEQQLDILTIKNNKLIGKINVKNDKNVLLITLPYEKGWRIKVDGKSVDYSQIIDNSFIGINLNKGDHKIEMVYYPPGFFCGAIISLSTIIYIIFIKNTRFCKK